MVGSRVDLNLPLFLAKPIDFKHAIRVNTTLMFIRYTSMTCLHDENPMFSGEDKAIDHTTVVTADEDCISLALMVDASEGNSELKEKKCRLLYLTLTYLLNHRDAENLYYTTRQEYESRKKIEEETIANEVGFPLLSIIAETCESITRSAYLALIVSYAYNESEYKEIEYAVINKFEISFNKKSSYLLNAAFCHPSPLISANCCEYAFGNYSYLVTPSYYGGIECDFNKSSSDTCATTGRTLLKACICTEENCCDINCCASTFAYIPPLTTSLLCQTACFMIGITKCIAYNSIQLGCEQTSQALNACSKNLDVGHDTILESRRFNTTRHNLFYIFEQPQTQIMEDKVTETTPINTGFGGRIVL